MLVVTVLLSVAATIVLLPTISECLSLLRLPWTPRRSQDAGDAPQPAFLFLVPAHNEEQLLPGCVASLTREAWPADKKRIVVVADNCTDHTAHVARVHGAEVLVRNDTSHRGKPWAIAWALEQLDLNGVDSVVILDADTEVTPGFLAALARRAPIKEKILQAFIDVQNRDESALTRLAAVHNDAEHGIAYQLKDSVGLNAPLCGNGMCIGTRVLRDHGWPAFSLGEDHELYGILTARGVRMESVRDARIVAQEVIGLRQSASQRHRWTAGRRHALLRSWTQIVISPHIGFAQRLDALAELTWFGPVMNLWFAGVGATLSWWLSPPGGRLIGLLFLASLIRVAAHSFLALLKNPEPGRALMAFAYLPIYLLWRIVPAIESLFFGRSAPWLRTERHARAETPQ